MSPSATSAGEAVVHGTGWLIGSIGAATAAVVGITGIVLDIAQSWLGPISRGPSLTGAEASDLASQTQTVTLFVVVPVTVFVTLLMVLGCRRGVAWMRAAGREMSAAWTVAVTEGPSSAVRALRARPRRERFVAAALTLLLGVATVVIGGALLYVLTRELISMIATRLDRAAVGLGTAIAVWTILTAVVCCILAAIAAEMGPRSLVRAQQWARAVVR